MARARLRSRALSTLDARKRQISVVFNFIDVFSKEYGLSPERRVELPIDLIPRATPISRTTYRMS